MTPAELRQLISDIEAGPVTRELADRVLEACGWRKSFSESGWEGWLTEDGRIEFDLAALMARLAEMEAE